MRPSRRRARRTGASNRGATLPSPRTGAARRETAGQGFRPSPACPSPCRSSRARARTPARSSPMGSRAPMRPAAACCRARGRPCGMGASLRTGSREDRRRRARRSAHARCLRHRGRRGGRRSAPRSSAGGIRAADRRAPCLVGRSR